jgi:hypothetical protein
VQALQAHGLSEPQARAVEFVMAWYGSPFDAVGAQRDRAQADGDAPGARLSWGAWPLVGPEIARALAAWKARAPERFAALVGVYGIDVAQRDDLRGPALVVVDPSRRGVVRGDAAQAAIASDARRLALLARAGRDEGARAAQVERVVAGSVQPVLRTPVERAGTRAPIGEVIVSARGVAALLCAARALDAAALEEAIKVAASDQAGSPSEDSLLDGLARYVRVSGHASAAHDIRRTLSSPELRS